MMTVMHLSEFFSVFPLINKIKMLSLQRFFIVRTVFHKDKAKSN